MKPIMLPILFEDIGEVEMPFYLIAALAPDSENNQTIIYANGMDFTCPLPMADVMKSISDGARFGVKQ